jgi:hypothetical protein
MEAYLTAKYNITQHNASGHNYAEQRFLICGLQATSGLWASFRWSAEQQRLQKNYESKLIKYINIYYKSAKILV